MKIFHLLQRCPENHYYAFISFHLPLRSNTKNGLIDTRNFLGKGIKRIIYKVLDDFRRKGLNATM